ncbi:serine/threonine-protein kinase Sgk2, partial [Blumeria hordei DH14]
MDDEQHFVYYPLDEVTSTFQRHCALYNVKNVESSPIKTTNLKVILDPLNSLLISLILYALNQPVPSSFNKRIDSRLKSFKKRINSKSIDLKHLKPLVRSIFSKATDTEIWFQLVSVLDIFEPHSTPDTFTSSLNYPDVRHRQTVALSQGKDQKVDILKKALWTEANGTIFEDVGGFYEKYFKMTPWADQCQAIAESFVNKKSKALFRFPKKSTGADIWRWVHKIQSEFIECYKAPTGTPSEKPASSKQQKTFPLRSNKFRTTSAWQFEGSESPRQVSFFFKSRNHVAGTPHDWRDVLVLGELTSSSVGVWKSKLLQLSIYMREVFIAQPLRRFVHGFLLFGSQLQLWVFDRSGPMSSGFIDIGENPEKLVYVITAYMLMSDNELGLDSNFVQEHDRTLIKVEGPETDNRLMLILEPFPFIVQRSIVSRGTTVYRGLYERFVVKTSWRAVGRMSEDELLGKARQY